VEAVPEIEAAGARLVVVTPQSAARAATWRDELCLGSALVIADPERTLYTALGARRPRPLWVLRPRVASAGVRALLAGERVSVTRGDDTLQLGADVVLDGDGRIAFLHLAADAADRTPPDELISVLRRLDGAPTPSMAREIPAVG
jgi:hypothetical protein